MSTHRNTRVVSPCPSDAVDDEEQRLALDLPASTSTGPGERVRDPLLSIMRHRLGGLEKDHSAYKIPPFVRLSIEATVALLESSRGFRTGITHVASWSLSLGLSRLCDLPGVQEISEARKYLLTRGCDTNFVDSWDYQLQPRGRRTVRIDLRRLDGAVAGQVKETAHELGLDNSSTVAALAMMAALQDVPLLGEPPRQMQSELEAFVAALHHRAALVRKLRAHAEPVLTAPRATWRDLVDRAKE